jgi:F-type H+-transporting ATPase subunit a
MIKTGILVIVAVSSLTALGSGVVVEFVDFYHRILHGLQMSDESIKHWIAVPGALVTLLVVWVVGRGFRSHCEKKASDPTPDSGFSVYSLIEIFVEFVMGVARDVIGDASYRKFLPILCGLFFFILVSNLSGLVPGFHPPTLNMDTNLAMGLCVFVYYNYAGIKEHGTSYIKQFLGPVAWMIPLMFVIELVAHMARPLSLSLRLYGNIFGDHLVLSVFTGLTWLLIPGVFMFFGLLVAFIQSFVFTLLSSIYISLAISHDH